MPRRSRRRRRLRSPAFFNAGASFTPSPVMPTMCPRCCKNVHDVILVLGEHLGKTIGLFDGFPGLRRLVMLRVAEAAGIENIAAEAERSSGLASDGHSVTGHHLYVDAHGASAGDRCFGLFARWVEQGEHPAYHPPFAGFVRASHTK